MEGRCMKCKKQVEIGNGKAVKMSNGMWSVKGTCSEPGCDCTVSRIVGKTKPIIEKKK